MNIRFRDWCGGKPYCGAVVQRNVLFTALTCILDLNNAADLQPRDLPWSIADALPGEVCEAA